MPAKSGFYFNKEVSRASKPLYLWSGDKCRDYWVTTYRSSRRIRGNRIGKDHLYWAGREFTKKTYVYQRTAIHGLTDLAVEVILKKGKKSFSCVNYHTRSRPDGLLDLFHIKVIRATKESTIREF